MLVGIIVGIGVGGGELGVGVGKTVGIASSVGIGVLVGMDVGVGGVTIDSIVSPNLSMIASTSCGYRIMQGIRRLAC